MGIHEQLVGAAGVVVRPDGARLHTVEAGDGPAVLLAHGYGVSAQEWSLVQPALVEQGLRVIAYDHRRHGLSTAGRDAASSHALFADLIAVVEHFDLRDVVLVGHSMGTFTVLGALAHARLRERTRAAVLVAAETGTLLHGASPAVRVLAPLASLGALPVIAGLPALGPYSAAQLCGSRAAPEVVEATRRALAAGRREAREFIPVMNRESVAAALPAIDLPITVIWGEDDDASPRWHADVVVDRAPQVRLVTLPGVGHMPNFEAPEAVVGEVLAAARAPVTAAAA